MAYSLNGEGFIRRHVVAIATLVCIATSAPAQTPAFSCRYQVPTGACTTTRPGTYTWVAPDSGLVTFAVNGAMGSSGFSNGVGKAGPGGNGGLVPGAVRVMSGD